MGVKGEKRSPKCWLEWIDYDSGHILLNLNSQMHVKKSLHGTRSIYEHHMRYLGPVLQLGLSLLCACMCMCALAGRKDIVFDTS